MVWQLVARVRDQLHLNSALRFFDSVSCIFYTIGCTDKKNIKFSSYCIYGNPEGSSFEAIYT
jgi:hypothetical protein